MKSEVIASLCSENYDQSYIDLISNLINTIRLDSDSNFQTTILILLNHKEPYVTFHVLNILRKVQLDRNIDRLLSSNFFTHIIDNLLRNEDEYVRQESALLVHSMALKKPHHKCTSKLISNNSKISLIDLVFLELCEMANDIDLRNRILACELLGTCTMVSQHVLMQALSKESIIGNASFKSDSNNNVSSGGGIDGIEINGSKGTIANKNENNLSYHINWSSRGALVHGLEDEFEAVRSATIKAIFSHTLTSSLFATKAIDMIIDTFNDDVESVRLLAVRTLHALCLVHKVKLEGDKLDATLSLIDDSMDELREATRSLLQKVEIKNVNDILSILSSLHRSLQKYPQDIDDVMITVSKIAQYNSSIVLSNIQGHFLKIERFFLIPEPKIEDHLHQMKMISILNVIKDDEILPEYVFKQYMYLRLEYPKAMPDFYRNDKMHDKFYSLPLENSPQIEKWIPNIKSLYSRYSKLLNNPVGLKTLETQLKFYTQYYNHGNYNIDEYNHNDDHSLDSSLIAHLELLKMLIDQRRNIPKDPRLYNSNDGKFNRILTFIWPLDKTELHQIETDEITDITSKHLYYMRINLKIMESGGMKREANSHTSCDLSFTSIPSFSAPHSLNESSKIEGIIHEMNPITEFTLEFTFESETGNHVERITIKPEFDQMENIWKFTNALPPKTHLIRFLGSIHDKTDNMILYENEDMEMDLITPLVIH